MSLDPLFSSGKVDWKTPKSLIAAIHAFRSIGLDPCASHDNTTGAADYYLPHDNGLALGWGHPPGSLVYCNPPYGRSVIDWVRKACSEYRSAASELMMLVPARTDTVWWHTALSGCDCVCFIKGRLKFQGAPSSAPFPSALLYWGEDVSGFSRHFHSIGVSMVVTSRD